MNSASKALSWMVFCAVWAGFAAPRRTEAQEPPAASAAGAPGTQSPQTTAQTEAGEPRAATSPAVSTPPSAASAAASAAPAASRPASRKRVSTPAGGEKPAAADRLELGTATVTGDREQPKVMYIVPWKKSDIGDLSGKPMNSLLDEALAPVDRDEFKREVVYYQAVKADASQNGASKAPTQQGEK